MFCTLETKSCCVAQVGLELSNLLSASGVLVCWVSYTHTQLKSWYLLNVHSIYSRHRRTQQTVASTPGDMTSTGTRTRVHPSTHTIKTKISQEAPHPASSTLSSQNLLDGSCSVPKQDAGCTQPTEEAQRHFLARESLESAIREPERGIVIYSRVCGSQHCYHSGSGKLLVCKVLLKPSLERAPL